MEFESLDSTGSFNLRGLFDSMPPRVKEDINSQRLLHFPESPGAGIIEQEGKISEIYRSYRPTGIVECIEAAYKITQEVLDEKKDVSDLFDAKILLFLALRSNRFDLYQNLHKSNREFMTDNSVEGVPNHMILDTLKMLILYKIVTPEELNSFLSEASRFFYNDTSHGARRPSRYGEYLDLVISLLGITDHLIEDDVFSLEDYENELIEVILQSAENSFSEIYKLTQRLQRFNPDLFDPRNYLKIWRFLIILKIKDDQIRSSLEKVSNNTYH